MLLHHQLTSLHRPQQRPHSFAGYPHLLLATLYESHPHERTSMHSSGVCLFYSFSFLGLLGWGLEGVRFQGWRRCRFSARRLGGHAAAASDGDGQQRRDGRRALIGHMWAVLRVENASSGYHYRRRVDRVNVEKNDPAGLCAGYAEPARCRATRPTLPPACSPFGASYMSAQSLFLFFLLHPLPATFSLFLPSYPSIRPDTHVEASENWDDDFEFQSSTSRSTRNSRQHDDDDDEHDNHTREKTPRIPRQRDSQSTTENWDDDFAGGADADAEVVAHQQHPSGSTDSHSTSSPLSSPIEPAASTSSFALPPPPRPSSHRQHPHRDRTPRASKIRPRPRAGSSSTATASNTGQWAESSDDDLDADELGFGEEEEEDRTVTARTGRRALSHTLASNGSPPPPVPPLPATVGPSHTRRNPGLAPPLHIPISDLVGTQPQPFPRSPTASVFSAPDQDRASIAWTHTSAGSTTRLTKKRPGNDGNGLAGLPPSPPIHRERERRRLRKKSRPQGTGRAVEMRPLEPRASSESTGEEAERVTEEEEVEDWDADLEREREAQMRPTHPYGAYAYANPNAHSRTSMYGSSAQVNRPPNATASTSQVGLPSVTGSGLLARIGSVKRWGAAAGVMGRRKKSSSVSVASESMGIDPELEAALANSHYHHQQQQPPLLRTGSQSSTQSRHSYAAPASSSSPSPAAGARLSLYSGTQEGYVFGSPSSGNAFPKTPPRPERDVSGSGNGSGGTSGGRPWFFRAGSGSPADRERERGRARVASPPDAASRGAGSSVGRDGSPAGDMEVDATARGKEKDKSKLVKRRSLGFVQIRRGLRPLNGEAENEATPTAGTSPNSAANTTTPTPTPGKTPTARNPHPTTTPNASPSKYGVLGVGRPPAGSVEDLGKQKEMGFVERNVRRISLVGARHRRTKSGVSITGLPASLDGERKIEQNPPPPPDVQLEPPSPPQTLRSPSGASALTMTAPISIALGSPPRSSVSPTLSTLNSPINSPISLASSSTPSLAPYSASSASPSPKAPLSPHSASLGRSAAANIPVVSAGKVSAAGTMRRNSLGDLKIPARISQAQHGLRRDLGMVREFARNVEELKELQATYKSLISEVQGLLDTHVLHPPTAPPKDDVRSSPTFFKRHRSNTSSSNPNAPSPLVQQQQAYKQLASAFYGINSKYRISWECAELLIELGGTGATPTTSSSAPTIAGGGGVTDGMLKTRGRAITLTDESKVPPSPSAAPLQTAASTSAIITSPSPPIASPPPSSAWRASTGRNDLSQRQLLLLKEMLGSPTPPGDDSFTAEDDIPEEAAHSPIVNRDWRWGDAMGSTVTLPSEESGPAGSGTGTGKKEKEKQRGSRLRMSGIRDMLRALKKAGAAPPLPVSTTSVNTESSGEPPGHLYQHGQVPTQGRRRRAKTSAGPESMRSANRPMSPYDPQASLKTASPRRPSLASIFRIGKSNKTTPPTPTTPSDDAHYGHELYPTFSGISGGRESANNSTGEEEDWDRLEDSASEIEAVASAQANAQARGTIRGRSPYGASSYLTPASGRPTTPMRSPSASGSRTSLSERTGGGPARATRLSNVEELPDRPPTAKPDAERDREGPSRQLSRSRRGAAPTTSSSLASKTGSVRSMPPAPPPSSLPALAMTPENIKPLLENAREVHMRLTDCISEIRALLAERP
ncbi:hypothetical protein MKEN_00835000 [Mycena kentingensis (nom. inval.)]|nr:hypothetical protein MKEN_00835000 [Mycena kentingensis (nom. inval.)]